MNEREFDAFLRETLRQPAPSHVPDEVRSNEVGRALAAIFDDAVWQDAVVGARDDDGNDRDNGRDDEGRAESHVWDDEPDSDDEWDDSDDPLLSSDRLDNLDIHGPDTSHDDFDTHHDQHGTHDSGTDHDPFGHDIGLGEHGLDET